MTMTRNVNGIEVELTPEEEAAITAEWESNANAPTPVPFSVTAGQLIKALDELDWLVQVDATVLSIGGLTARLWDRAVIFERADPMIEGIALALEKTTEQVDDLFRLADTF